MSEGTTPSQTLGPFFGFALPFEGGPELVAASSPGIVRIEGQVLDGDGEPVTDALLEIHQADPEGRYGTAGLRSFGRCRTDPEGAFHFVTVRPGPVPAADGRGQAPHIHLTVFARGLLRSLSTRIYFPDEPLNETDPLLASIEDPGIRATLIASPEAGALRFDVRLQGDRETAFLAL